MFKDETNFGDEKTNGRRMSCILSFAYDVDARIDQLIATRT